MSVAMTLNGKLRISSYPGQHTKGDFTEWVKVNARVLRRYFGVDLFPGSLNIDVLNQPAIHKNLDNGVPPPTFVIPVAEVDNGEATHLGDGQAWKCELKIGKFPTPIECWAFRRINSGVPAGVIEVVSHDELVGPYKLRHGDAVVIDIFSTQQVLG